jgi:heme exporter protein D
MGGYAFYVWGSFGITALAMLAESLLIRSQRTSVLNELADEREAQRSDARSS